MGEHSDWTEDWQWGRLVEGKRSKFVVLDSEQRPAAASCSSKHRPLKLPSGLFYRLDFLEVAPRYRGTTLGVFTLAIIANRALELQCQGLVLSTFPIDGLREYYEGAGGVEGALKAGTPCELGSLSIQLEHSPSSWDYSR